MISPRLLQIVRCPDCTGVLREHDAQWTCTACGRSFDTTAGYADLRPAAAYAEQTKYLDAALHTDARHETVAPPLLGSKIRNDMLRAFLRLRPGDRVLDLGCGSGRTMIWNADTGASMTGIDISPFFSREALEGCDLALGDLRRLPLADGAFHKAWALDVLEHLSPQALREVLSDAARVLEENGTLFLYTHVRKNGPLGAGVRLVNRFAHLCERIGLIDLRQERLRKSDHLNPIADHDELLRVLRECGFQLDRITYYTPIAGAFVENVIIRIAERFLTRSAARGGGLDAGAASRAARSAAKTRLRRGGATYLALRALSALMMLDVRLFGRMKSGPFFALVRKTRFARSSMRILYAALDQVVPGTLGGSVHVQAVAEGLAALGHEVHVAAQVTGAMRESRTATGPGVEWTSLGPPLGHNALRWMRARTIEALARRIRADVVIERVLNFGGEGVIAAHRLGRPAVLEVNAPVIDYPGSPKARLDRALLFEPMRRWRDRLCRMTSLFVTPSAAILPPWVDPSRVMETEWGADTDRFQPQAAGPTPVPRDPGRITCVFAGAFRTWHGAAQLGAALARLHRAGDDRFAGLFIGDGPERAATERAAAGTPRIVFTGALPHDALPAALAAADLGVAPFDIGRHPALKLGFYWSPLKVFEYMACGLPVVAPRLPRLAQLVEQDREGWLYEPDDPAGPRGLDAALSALADRPTRARLGAAARDRAVRDFSWRAHCAALDARLRDLIAPRLRRTGTS